MRSFATFSDPDLDKINDINELSEVLDKHCIWYKMRISQKKLHTEVTGLSREYQFLAVEHSVIAGLSRKSLVRYPDELLSQICIAAPELEKVLLEAGVKVHGS